jgi:hypothetical protein
MRRRSTLDHEGIYRLLDSRHFKLGERH